jgi:hypothetical protein
VRDVPRAGRQRAVRVPGGALLPRGGDGADPVLCRQLLPGAGVQPDAVPVRVTVPRHDGPATAVRVALLLPGAGGVGSDAVPDRVLLPGRRHVRGQGVPARDVGVVRRQGAPPSRSDPPATSSDRADFSS